MCHIIFLDENEHFLGIHKLSENTFLKQLIDENFNIISKAYSFIENHDNDYLYDYMYDFYLDGVVKLSLNVLFSIDSIRSKPISIISCKQKNYIKIILKPKKPYCKNIDCI